MEELVSIIVPIYNLEKHINKCVLSIVNQTYKKIEIILVDDGSDEDESPRICDEWGKKDKRIKVIHKENGGLSSARNEGIKNSVGSYLMFIDGDDYIENDMVENLYKSVTENNAQIATCGFIYQTYVKQEIRHSKENYVVDSEEALRRLFACDDMSQAICDKIFKRELFDTIKFPEGKFHEDIGTLWKLIDKAERVSHINKCGYHYVQRKGSILHRKFTIEQLSLIEFREEIVKNVAEKYPNILNEAENIFIRTLINCIILCYRNNMQKKYKELKEKLKSYMPRVMKNPKMKLKIKIKSILILYFGGSRVFKK